MDKTILINQCNEYVDFCKDIRKMSPRTIKNKRATFRIFIRYVDCERLEDLTNEIFSLWVDKLLDNGVSVNGTNDYISRVTAMLRWHKESGTKMPLKIPLIPKYKGEPRRRSYYSKSVVEKVIANSNEIPSLMIRIGFDTGMRLNELTQLRLSNFKGNKVTYVGKGRIWHTAYLRRKTYHKLLEYIRDYDIKDYLWIENHKQTPLSSQTVAKYMKKAFTNCGIDDFHPHALRHSFATNLQKQGATIEEIQHMIGHSSAAITEQYLHGFDEEKMAQLFKKYA